ncbi:MAG: OmpH family outer membrane protein [Alphaproteobacteria bacterium]
MKIKHIAALLILFSLPVSAAFAQDAFKPVIAVIDINGVERQSVAWDSLRQQVESRRAAYQEQLAGREKELQEKGQELQSQQTLLDSEVLKAREDELRTQVAQLRQQAIDVKKTLDKLYASARRQIRDALVVVVNEIAAEKGIHLILNMSRQDQTVAYADNRLNISQEALERLNGKIQSVSLDTQ